jgi:DNA-binding MarR family transcriptional regulator/GNAT superfamily N-acetyltransferase
MQSPQTESRIAAVRAFNRFYTQRIGVLRKGAYGSKFSLAEVRVLYELAHRDRTVATTLAEELDLDPGYLSRILQGFGTKGWVQKRAAAHDARAQELQLTAAGRRAFAPLDRASHDEIAALLQSLHTDDAERLTAGLQTVAELLGAPRAPDSVVLREHRPGDIGWIIQRHGELYAQEYGWDATFEALVADIGAKFIRDFDPARERCWIAERGGARIGSVLVVRKTRTIAQLRLLLVEPSARGLGVGKRLVDECLAFARARGYRKMMLWTNAGLDAARGIYEARGFVLTNEERHQSFGHALLGQTFELTL